MRQLSNVVTESLADELRARTKRGDFPGVDFRTAMRFLLSDGILPASNLPVDSFLRLEDWARSFDDSSQHRVTATELKNKTGSVIQRVLRGEVLTIYRHGQPIAEIRAVARNP